MFVLAHLGMGRRLASPWTRGLPLVPLLVGTLLPDLIDKPLYYGLKWISSPPSNDLGLISSTRTLGHTAVFLILMVLLTGWTRQRTWGPTMGALTLGVATHDLLDCVSDVIFNPTQASSGIQALVFPLQGFHFSGMPFLNLQAHAETVLIPHVWIGEMVGLFLLLTDAQLRARWRGGWTR